MVTDKGECGSRCLLCGELRGDGNKLDMANIQHECHTGCRVTAATCCDMVSCKRARHSAVRVGRGCEEGRQVRIVGMQG